MHSPDVIENVGRDSRVEEPIMRVAGHSAPLIPARIATACQQFPVN
jgi:hypothetical protein